MSIPPSDPTLAEIWAPPPPDSDPLTINAARCAAAVGCSASAGTRQRNRHPTTLPDRVGGVR